MSISPTFPEPLLSVEDLRVSFVGRRATVQAVNGIGYTVKSGEAVGLVGESGSGKSVSALAILGLLRPQTSRVAGSAKFAGQELIGQPERVLRAVRGARIGLVFQDPLSSLNPVLSIQTQLTEQLITHEGTGRREARERALALIKSVGIPDPDRRLKQFPHELSGGMRQRAMIAMALACRPAFLIADEPTTALDVTIQAQILDLLAELRERLNMSLLLITHDLGVAAGHTDRLAVMYAGRIVETGRTEAVLGDPSHPYTEGLLSAVPRLDRARANRLVAIPGAPPDPTVAQPGCPFVARCSFAQSRCYTEDPRLEPLAAERQVACWAPRHAGAGAA